MPKLVSKIPWYEIVASVIGLVMVMAILWLSKPKLDTSCQCHQMCDQKGHGCAASRCVTRDGVPPARPANGWGQ